MAANDRYFVGSGNWNDTTKWSTTDGGTTGSAVPTVGDNVFLTANSVSVNINTGATCLTFNCTGFNGTLSGASGLTVSGNVTLSATMTITATSPLTVNQTATLTSNGKAWNGNTALSLETATYTIVGNWTCQLFTSSGAASPVKTINGGTITANNGFTSTRGTTGTATIIVKGGTWTGTGVIQNNLTIDGNVTLGATTNFNTGLLKHQSGAVPTTGNTMTFGASTTLDTGGIEWNNITLAGVSTYTLLSALNISAAGTFNIGGGAVKTFNGSAVNIKGAFTVPVAVNGTSVFNFVGPVTWTGSAFVISNPVHFNAPGNTITLSGNCLTAGNVAWTAGTMAQINTGVLIFTTSQTIDLKGAPFPYIGFSTSVDRVFTLLSDMVCTLGLSSSGNGNKTLMGNRLFLQGDITVSNTGTFGLAGSTTELIYNGGTGTWSSASIGGIGLNFTIASGTLNMGSTAVYSTGTLKTQGGTINAGTGTLTLGSATLDTGGVSWNNINISTAGSATISLGSPLTVTGTMTTVVGNPVTFAGTAGFTVANISDTTTGTKTYVFTPGNTYRITTSVKANNTDPAAPIILQSATPGTRAALTLDTGATCNLGYVNFTDIDASGGRQINTFKGVVLNCKNVVSYNDPVRSIAKSFAA